MPRPACPLAHVLASVLALTGIGSLDLTLGAGFFHEIADEVFQGSRKWLLTIDPLPVVVDIIKGMENGTDNKIRA